MRFARLGALGCLSWLALGSNAKIDDAWDSILPLPAAPAAPAAKTNNPNSDFLKRFFFESRAEYWHVHTTFTGLPTITGVIDAPFTGVFNPSGIPYPAAFQPDADRLYSFIDWGTRGWLSDRVDTHFAMRYEQDLSRVLPAAPAQGFLETFPGNRRIEFLNASVDIKGGQTWDLALGRQSVYGAEMAAIDGASLTVNRPAFALTVYGGRRFSYFSDPGQRAIGGANATFRVGRNASVEVDTLWYIKGENTVAWRQRLGSDWLLSAYFRTYGGAPVDFSAQAFYSPGGGRTSLRASFFQKLTNRDYVYDYTLAARDLSRFNADPRLYLGPFSPFTQFTFEANRRLTPALWLGGSLWLRRLNDNNDQGPFNTSFQDYRLHANVFPPRRLAATFEYHQHDSDRLSPANATTFDDISRSGETSVKDLTGQIGRSFAEGRLNLNGGAYYRRIDMQDRFFLMSGLHQSGWLAGGWWRLDQRTRIYADYNLDNDFFLFYPSLRNSRILRLGINWKY